MRQNDRCQLPLLPLAAFFHPCTHVTATTPDPRGGVHASCTLPRQQLTRLPTSTPVSLRI